MKSIFFELLVQLFLKMDLNQISSFGKSIGFLMWIFVPSRRKRAISSIQKHLNVSKKEAREMAWKNFLNTGQSFVEIFYNPKVDYRFLRERVEIKNKEVLEEIQKSKRPVVGVTAHMGSWELLSGIMSLLFPHRITQIVVREPDDIVVRKIVKRLRQKYKHEIIARDNSAPKIVKGLKNQGVSAFLVDHNCGRRKAIFLPFLREIAAINFGPALLAVRTRSLVFPIFLIRGGGKGYILYPKKPLDTLKLQGTLREKVKKVCKFYTMEVENMVLKYPTQWYWIHNRWRTRPPTNI